MTLYKLLKESGFRNLFVLLKRLLIVFVIYQITRIVFYFYNIHHFSEVGLSDLLRMLWGGLRFDLTAIIYLNFLFILASVIPLKSRNKKGFQKFLFVLFLLTNSIGYAFNTLDIFYFDFILKRSTFDVFMFASEQNIGLLLWQFLKDYWLGFILWVILVYGSYRYYKTIKEKATEAKAFPFYVISSILFLLVAYFSIIGIRGGFTRTTRPITLNNAGAYTKKPLELAIVLNTPFTIIKTVTKQSFKPKNYYSESELDAIYSPYKHFETDSTFASKNVVIIIVESLAREYIGSLNKTFDKGNYQGYTPFLDSLISKSHTFSNAYANGRKSIDALPSIIASVPSLVQPYILSPYSTNSINGIGNILEKKGYQTAFFHGAPNGSMGFDAFMNMSGLKEYYGYDEYDNSDDFDGSWGIWDEEFLQFTATELTNFQEPFLASIFTITSHHPFKIPEKYEAVFKEGTLPIHKSVQYTDYALKQFFKKASKMPWFDNTIFIITADHCNQTIIPSYKNSLGAFAVPIIFYQPSQTNLAKMDTTVTQQVDILPILLRKLNYSGDFISFGSDSQNDSFPFAINFINQTWQFVDNDYFLQYRDGKSVGLYLYKTDILLKNNLLLKEPETIKRLEKFLKAYIQQYYNRLIENRMTVVP